MQSRLRSKTAWMAVIALVLFVLKTYLNIELKEADKLVELILICASTLGIWNNPVDKNRW